MSYRWPADKKLKKDTIGIPELNKLKEKQQSKNQNKKGKRIMDIMKEKEAELFLENGGADILYEWAVNQFVCDNQECYSLAIRFYEIAAEQGHGFALNNLGALYSEGRFVEKDTKKAMEYYIKSAETGCSEACCNLGYFYLYGKNNEVDYKKAYEYFSRGAMLGNDANCLYKLGDMYMHGDYVEKNPDIAFEFYIKSLDVLEEYGDTYVDEFTSDINYRIGKCLYEGIGVQQDKRRAMEYLEMALNGYKSREHDAYNYVNKRIDEIEYMIEQFNSL